MGIFSRLSDIINSNLNAILDRAEDPEKLIRLVIQEMEDTLVEVRSGMVRTLAEKKELARRVFDLDHEAEDWQRKAELALSRGREDLAKAALVARARIAEQANAQRRQLVHVEEALARSNEDIGKLQAKLDDAKTREKAIAIRAKAATSRLKVRTQLYDQRITDAFARFEHVERSLDALEGKVDAFDIGRGRGLADEFAELEADAGIEKELNEMKARLNRAAAGPNQG